MRCSTLVVAALSALAIAAPLEKRVYVTDITTEVVTITVTEGQERPTPHPTHGHKAQAPKLALKPAPIVVISTVAPAPAASVVATYEAPSKPAAAAVVQNVPESVPVAVEIKTSAPAPAKTTEAAVEVPAATTKAATSSPAAAPPTDYKGKVLYHHNVHRANHSSPDLTYDDSLASYAATVASTCKFAHDITVGGGGYGQNIAESGSTGSSESDKDAAVLAGGVISDMWYNSELPLYMPRFSGIIPATDDFMSWGHFSQVVWKGTQSVGCATQYCKAGTDMFPGEYSGWFTVCNYKSAGNMGGAYEANVLPPLGNPTIVG